MGRKSESKNDIYTEIKRLYGLDKRNLDRLIEEYKNGETAFKLSQKYSVGSSANVYTITQKYQKSTGITLREKSKERKKKSFDRDYELEKLEFKYNLYEYDLREIVKMYREDGASAMEIAKKYRIKTTTNVYQIIERAEKIFANSDQDDDQQRHISEEEIQKQITIFKLNRKYGVEIPAIADSFNIEGNKVESSISFIERAIELIKQSKEKDANDSQIIQLFKRKGIDMSQETIDILNIEDDKGKSDR